MERIKLTNEEYLDRVIKIFGNDLTVDGLYVNNRTKINHTCNIHNTTNLQTPAQVLNGHNGCKQCSLIKRINGLKDTLEDVKEKVFNKWGNEYEVLSTEYIDHNQKMLFRHNLKSGRSHNIWSKPGRILADCECAVCCGMQVCEGFNDIATTDPEIASLFLHEEDTHKYMRSSNKKAWMKCPLCGHPTYKNINQVTRDRDVRCPICSDGISYPNKFIYNCLLQLDGLDFLKREFSPEWCEFYLNGNKRCGIYDIYFGFKNKEYIVEMDGGLGHGNKNFGKSTISLEDSIAIDDEKDRLAKEHNINIIRIDADYGFNDRFEYIKNNILNSILSDILDLHNIDFQYVNIESQKSIFLECCKLWNAGFSAAEIVEKTGVNKSTLSVYLKRGTKYNLCQYDAKTSVRRSSAKPVICLNTKQVFETTIDASKYYHVNQKGIINCCKGTDFSAGKDKNTGEKLFWMYYEEYLKLSEEEINQYLDNKIKLLDKYSPKKKVVCITTKVLFSSITIGAKYYGTYDTAVAKCCKGILKSAGKLEDGTKLQWMYYEDYIKLYNKEDLEEYVA